MLRGIPEGGIAMSDVESIMYVLIATYVAIAVLAHVLLITAIIQCWRDDLAGGKRSREAHYLAASTAPVKAA
jgi:hypothetical protein